MISQQNWWQLSSIQIGGAICLPVIMIGHVLSQNYGFSSAILSILLGNGILLFLGLISAKMSYEKQKTTMENAKDYFGEKGVLFFSLTMILSLLGWYGIQLNMMSLSVLDLLSIDTKNSYFLNFLNITLGLLVTLVALWGIRALNFLADISMPLLLSTLAYAMFTVDKSDHISPHTLSFVGASAVIAMAIAVVIDLPTFFRHAQTCKDAYLSIFLIFGVTLPILEIIGVYLASGQSGGTILDVLKRQNGLTWNIWVASFLILAGWTTNNLNLYSGVICLEPLLKKQSERMCTLLIGGLGTLLSCLNLLNHLEIVLDIMGIFITSMGTVIIVRYIFSQFRLQLFAQEHHLWNLFAWGCGIICGFLGMKGISLTSIPVLDSALGACLGALLTPIRRGFYEKAQPG